MNTAADDSDARHDYIAYTHGCRCEICRASKADYMRERRAQAREKAQEHTCSSTGRRGSRHTAQAPGAHRHLAAIATHGTRYGYEEAGCRCGDCTAARTSSDIKYRKDTT